VFKVVKMSVDPNRFIKETETGKEVTSVCLHVYLDEWKSRKETYLSNKNLAKIWSSISSILNTVRAALNGPLEAFRQFLDERHDADLQYWPNIALSIAALGWTLQEASYHFYQPPEDGNQYQWGNHPILKKRLEQAGWCKAEITRFLENEDIDFLLYVSSITSPRAEHDHAKCHETICRGSAANADQYVTKHAPNCPGDCSMWEMPEPSVDIIKEGGIPLTHWSDVGLEVFTYIEGTDMPYVAISHV
jgi:hypothetical protein